MEGESERNEGGRGREGDEEGFFWVPKPSFGMNNTHGLSTTQDLQHEQQQPANQSQKNREKAESKEKEHRKAFFFWRKAGWDTKAQARRSWIFRADEAGNGSQTLSPAREQLQAMDGSTGMGSAGMITAME